MSYGQEQARKREVNKREKSKKSDYLNYELVHIRLLAAEREAFEHDAEHYHMPFEEFAARQLGLGRKISLGVLNDGDTINLSVTGKSDDDDCCYQVLSVFGPDLDLCVALWTFKDTVICGEDSWQEAEAKRFASRPQYG